VTTISANLPPISGVKRDVDRYFTTDGARLRYRDEGHGPPVLMLHGWTLDLQMWEPQISALRDAFRLVRFDRRGFGLSSGRPSVVHDIADIGSLCEHLSIGRVALVGMSQGARAAIGFALAAPARISCLILDGPPDFGREALPADDDVPLSDYRALVQARGMAAFRREWAAHPLLSLRTRDPRMREILGAMILRYPGNDLKEPVTTIGAHADVAPTGAAPIRSIEVPVLVLTGDHDLPSRTQAANSLAAQLTHAERAVIPAAGHLPNLDNPKLYNAVVRTFLERFSIPLR
jgi:pimeloyl-ACP methyl ester carboxylesterase